MNIRPAENYGLPGLPTETEYLRADRTWLIQRERDLLIELDHAQQLLTFAKAGGDVPDSESWEEAKADWLESYPQLASPAGKPAITKSQS